MQPNDISKYEYILKCPNLVYSVRPADIRGHKGIGRPCSQYVMY